MLSQSAIVTLGSQMISHSAIAPGASEAINSHKTLGKQTSIAAQPSTKMSKSSKCSAILVQSQSSLTNVTRFDISEISQDDGIPPKGRTQYLTIISSGVRDLTSLAMTKKIVNNCQKIGFVRFVVNGTDDQSVYGLLGGKVQLFKCIEMDRTPKWGEYTCP